MNIKNEQITRLNQALDLLESKVTTKKEKAIMIAAKAVIGELEIERIKLNTRSSKFITAKRVNDPLYARSEEYKRERVEKAKRILELYGKE